MDWKMTKIIFGINVPYQSREIDFDATDAKRKELEKTKDFVSFMECRVTRPVIRHKDLSFELCDICGSGIPPGRVSRKITTCCPECNVKKWDAKNGLIIEKERNACGVRPTSFWQTISYECFRRDNFTCQHCKKDRDQLRQDAKDEQMINGKCNTKYQPTDYVLNCHHIKPIKDGGNNRLENLITLCGKCHKIEHSRVKNIARKHRPLIPDS
jgi:hypothetical protein